MKEHFHIQHSVNGHHHICLSDLEIHDISFFSTLNINVRLIKVQHTCDTVAALIIKMAITLLYSPTEYQCSLFFFFDLNLTSHSKAEVLQKPVFHGGRPRMLLRVLIRSQAAPGQNRRLSVSQLQGFVSRNNQILRVSESAVVTGK